MSFDKHKNTWMLMLWMFVHVKVSAKEREEDFMTRVTKVKLKESSIYIFLWFLLWYKLHHIIHKYIMIQHKIIIMFLWLNLLCIYICCNLRLVFLFIWLPYSSWGWVSFFIFFCFIHSLLTIIRKYCVEHIIIIICVVIWGEHVWSIA